MKNKKIIAAAAAAVIILIIFAVRFFFLGGGEQEKYQYAACVLIDNGLYDEAREMVSAAQKIKENEYQKVLTALTYLLEGRNIKAEKYVQLYLKTPKVKAAKELLNLMSSEEATEVDYRYLADDIADNMSASKKIKQEAKAFVEAKKYLSGTETIDIETIIKELETTDNSVSFMLIAQIKAFMGDTDTAINYAKKAAEKSKSLSDQIAVANLAASGAKAKDWVISDEDLNDNKPYKRALNYLLALRNKQNEESVEYKLTLSRMYFYCDEDILSEKAFTEAMMLARDKSQGEYTAESLNNYIETYDSFFNDTDRLKEETKNFISKMTKHMLYYPNPERVSDNSTYGEFISSIVAEKSMAVSAGYIETENFPVVRVNINTLEKAEKLILNNGIVNVYDTGRIITESNIIQKDEKQANICIVIDNIEGMEDMSHFISATKNFAGSLPKNTNVGIIVLENKAENICKLTDSEGVLKSSLDLLDKNYKSNGKTDYSVYTNIALKGVNMAVDMLKNEEGSKIILFVSSALNEKLDSMSSLFVSQSDKALNLQTIFDTAKSEKIQVFGLLHKKTEKENFEWLLSEAGGRLFCTSQNSDISNAYAALSEYAHRNVVIEYNVSENSKDYKRNISITLNDGSFEEEKYTVGLESGYYTKEENNSISSDIYRQNGGSY